MKMHTGSETVVPGTLLARWWAEWGVIDPDDQAAVAEAARDPREGAPPGGAELAGWVAQRDGQLWLAVQAAAVEAATGVVGAELDRVSDWIAVLCAAAIGEGDAPTVDALIALTVAIGSGQRASAGAVADAHAVIERAKP